MDHERFRDWLSHVDGLTRPSARTVMAALSGRPEGAASLAAIELGVDGARRCPHLRPAAVIARQGALCAMCKACGHSAR